MPVYYKIYQDNRERNPNKGKWYARATTIGTKELKDIAELIQRNASVKRSDVMAVLLELSEVLNDILCDGYRVKIDGFGSFKVGIRTSAANSEEEFSASKNIIGSRIIFQPETEKAGSRGQRTRVLAKRVEFKDFAKKKKTKV